MATWEDLDNELGSDKDEAEDEANVDLGLVATMAFSEGKLKYLCQKLKV